MRLCESCDAPATARPVLRLGTTGTGPRPPVILLDLLPFFAQTQRPSLVIDLGSGTGLSTRFWADRADSVVGVEVNPEMRAYAETVTSEANVRYVAGPSHATGLPNACADIVTSAQSLQWMEPTRTFDEVGRVLRPGGVFAAYNYNSLLTGSSEVDQAFAAVRDTVGRLHEELGLNRSKRRWPVTSERLKASGKFRFTSETSVHSVESGNADRLVGFLLSEGSVTTLLERVPEETIGLDRLRTLAASMLGAEPRPWYIGYSVWLGVK
jgi:SAM-dependent methyltransferase